MLLSLEQIWRNRSAAAYGAVTRTDGPTARWIYQGYALGIASGSELQSKCQLCSELSVENAEMQR